MEEIIHVLNLEERQRGPGSAFRLFITPNILPLSLLEKGILDKTRKDLFNSTISLALSSLKVKHMNKVDLMFILIIKSEHVFLMVLDLKTPSFEIIDNMSTGITQLERYEHIPTVMRYVLANYLLDNDHQHTLKVHHQTSKFLKLPWKITNNGVDSGIFCMRHMENTWEVVLNDGSLV
ncbi:hypothetical protein R6Q57_001873 [Mikania cordata]